MGGRNAPPQQDHKEGAQIFISESGLYSLVMSSKKAEAKAFKRWVTTVILPSIRKTGSYSVRDEQLVPHTTPEESSQRIRRLCLENDDLERQSILATRQALLDIGETVDDAQEWSIRDRLSNLLRG